MRPGRPPKKHRGSRTGVTAVGLALLLPLLVLAPRPLSGQDGEVAREIQESERRLERIREERSRLQSEMSDLRDRVRDVSGELRNIERQISASRSVLAEIDFQLDATTERVQENTTDLIRARERLRESRAVLQRRLRDIYKRGPLHSAGVLLRAESFADLLNRYRYLRLIASYDRSLVENVQALEEQLLERSRELDGNLSALGRLRQDKLSEVADLRSVEQRHQAAIRQYRSREEETRDRLRSLEEDERRMASLIGDLEERRREEEARRRTTERRAERATLASGDAGELAWPVDGEILYRFGRDRRPDGTILRWNGVGIGAAAGTPVRAVREGRVVLAGPFEGYGPTVVLSHGDGFYTLYLYLEEIGVVEGRDVAEGQVVGTVGGTDTPEGPHIEFQVRAPEGGGAPEARDPLLWLRSPSGG